MTKRKEYISVLNVLSSLAVVYLHANTFWEYKPDRNWVLSNFIESFFYFAVPVFFMITGATLLGYRKRTTTKDFFKKRLSKTVIPLLFWSIFSICFAIIIDFVFFDAKAINYSALEIINSITNVKFPYNGIYWYFPVLFTAYLSIPVLSAIDENKKKAIYEYIMIGSFIINILLPFLTSLTNGKIGYNSAFYFTMGMGYIHYMIFGYYVDNYGIEKKFRIIIYSLGIVGLMTHFVGTWLLSNRDGAINGLFKDYNNIPTVLYAYAIFLLFKNINFDKVPQFIMSVISFFRNQTFGVYLIHYFIILVINLSGLININSKYYKAFAPIAIFVISSLIIRLLQKIPFIKKIVP